MGGFEPTTFAQKATTLTTAQRRPHTAEICLSKTNILISPKLALTFKRKKNRRQNHDNHDHRFISARSTEVWNQTHESPGEIIESEPDARIARGGFR